MTNYNEQLTEIKANNQNLFASAGATGQAFRQMHRDAIQPGALSTKAKELQAVAIAVATRCEGCIVQHVKSAIKLGVSREELVETINVAIMMGGGPATVYGGKALECADQFFKK